MRLKLKEVNNLKLVQSAQWELSDLDPYLVTIYTTKEYEQMSEQITKVVTDRNKLK